MRKVKHREVEQPAKVIRYGAQVFYLWFPKPPAQASEPCDLNAYTLNRCTHPYPKASQPTSALSPSPCAQGRARGQFAK